MKLSQFKYKLTDDRIALYPAPYRDESRLLVLHKKTGEIEHRIFKEVIDKIYFLHFGQQIEIGQVAPNNIDFVCIGSQLFFVLLAGTCQCVQFQLIGMFRKALYQI